jgi:hypothetical protein
MRVKIAYRNPREKDGTSLVFVVGRRADIAAMADGQKFLDVTLTDGRVRTIATNAIIEIEDVPD